MFRRHIKVCRKYGEKYQVKCLEISVQCPDFVLVWFAKSYRGVQVLKKVLLILIMISSNMMTYY
jgi:hypothetical protein